MKYIFFCLFFVPLINISCMSVSCDPRQAFAPFHLPLLPSGMASPTKLVSLHQFHHSVPLLKHLFPRSFPSNTIFTLITGSLCFPSHPLLRLDRGDGPDAPGAALIKLVLILNIINILVLLIFNGTQCLQFAYGRY